MKAAESTRPLRLLYLGPYNSPHLEDLAVAMLERGHVVRAAGEVWGGGLPPSSLPERGVPVDTMTFPYVLSFRRLLREFKPDLVHAHWMPFATLAMLAGARPLVAQAWGSDVYLAGRRHRFELRVALRRTADGDGRLGRPSRAAEATSGRSRCGRCSSTGASTSKSSESRPMPSARR